MIQFGLLPRVLKNIASKLNTKRSSALFRFNTLKLKLIIVADKMVQYQEYIFHRLNPEICFPRNYSNLGV